MKVIEQLLIDAGISPIAGVDEAGRGACAGPLVVAAVILKDNDRSLREEVYSKIGNRRLDDKHKLNDIFDELISSNGYFYTYDDDYSVPNVVTTIEGVGYYPQAGRHFMAGLTLQF